MTGVEIIAAIDLAIALLGRLNNVRASLKQSGELTPEQDAALDAKFKAAFDSPHWQNSNPTGSTSASKS
jgi:hypothetical protein